MRAKTDARLLERAGDGAERRRQIRANSSNRPDNHDRNERGDLPDCYAMKRKNMFFLDTSAKLSGTVRVPG